MNDSDRTDFVRLLAGVAEVYDKRLSDVVVAVYWDALRHVDLRAIAAAAKRHIQDPERGHYMPKPADLLSVATPTRGAIVAWAEVEDAMVRYGAYRSVQFADATTNAVIRDLGGWPVVCREHNAQPWIEKEFAKRYQEYQNCGRTYNGSLPGIHETENRAAGYLEAIPDPVLIGPPEARLELGPGKPPPLKLIK